MKWKYLGSSISFLWAISLSSTAHATWQIPTEGPKGFQVQKQDVFAVDASKNGEFFASSSFDGTTQVWRTQNWEALYTFPGHANWVGDVAFHPSW